MQRYFFCFLLFFLPLLEGDLRTFGYIFLLFFAGLIFIFEKAKLQFDFWEILFLLFLVFASFSTLFSAGRSRSLLELFRYLAYFLIFLSVRRLSPVEQKILKKNYFLAIVLSSLILSFAYLSFFLGKPFLPSPTTGMNLYFPVFGHNRLADLLLFSLPMLYFSLINSQDYSAQKKWFSKEKMAKLGKLFAFIFLSLVFVFCFAKSGYLVLIFVFLLIVSFLEKTVKVKKRFLRIIIFPTILVGFAFIFLVFNTYFLKIKERPSYSRLQKPLYLDWRWEYYSLALKGVISSPVVGVGLDNFRYLSKQYQSKPSSWSWYGENYYFTFLSEVGLLGGVAMIAFFLYFFLQAPRNLKDLFSWGIFFSLVASSLHSFFSVDWYFLSLFLLFFLGAGLLLPYASFPSFSVKSNFLTILAKGVAFFLIAFSIIYALGIGFFYHGKVQNYEKLIELSRFLTFFDFEHQIKIANWYKEKKDWKSALNYLETAKRLEPKETVSYLEEGEIFLSLGKKDEAIAQYFQILLLNPLDFQDYYFLIYKFYLEKIEGYLKKENPSQALILLREVLQMFPAFAQEGQGVKLFLEAKKELEMGNYQKAKVILGKYVQEEKKIKKRVLSQEEIWQTARNYFLFQTRR